MKTRNFFVSNSSSSSFIAVLPDDFKLKDHFTEDMKSDAYIDEDLDLVELEDAFQKQFDASEDLPLEIYQYEDDNLFTIFEHLFGNKFEKNVLSQADVHSDGDGFVHIFKKRQIKSFLEGV